MSARRFRISQAAGGCIPVGPLAWVCGDSRVEGRQARIIFRRLTSLPAREDYLNLLVGKPAA